MKAIERLKQYIDFKELNNSLFEKENSLSNGYIATQLKRNADLGEGILNKILDNCLEISPEWLLTGNGEMLKDREEVKNMVNEPGERYGLDYKELYLREKQTVDLQNKYIASLELQLNTKSKAG